MTLDGVNSYAGGTKVADATLVIGANGTLAPGNVTIGDGNAVLQLAANTGGESISSLSILSGSFLDVGNNHIVISDPGGSIDATIRGYLANGYNNGNWNGTSGAATGGGIGTSSATGTKYGIGYADGTDGGISGITSDSRSEVHPLRRRKPRWSVNSMDFGTWPRTSASPQRSGTRATSITTERSTALISACSRAISANPPAAMRT